MFVPDIAYFDLILHLIYSLPMLCLQHVTLQPPITKKRKKTEEEDDFSIEKVRFQLGCRCDLGSL